jgi:hypothetical protein
MTEPSQSQADSWDGAAVYCRDEGAILRAIAGTSLLVPIQRGLADLQQIYALHGVGACIYQHLDGANTLDDVLAVVLDRYDVTADAARRDIRSFIESLTSSKLVERRG